MTERPRLWRWALGLSAAAALLRVSSLNLLLDRDEGEYATLAWLWRTGQGLPYRDFLEQKPPLAIAANALAQSLFSDGIFGLRLLSLLWIVATVLAQFFLVEALARRGRLGWRLRSEPQAGRLVAGLGALVSAFLLSAARSQSLAANTETWQTLPLLGALALLFLPEPGHLGPRHYLACGLALGVASLFKQPVLVGLLFLPWAAQRGPGFLKAVLLTLGGAALAWGLALAVMAQQGAGLEFLNCTVAYNQGYVAQGWSGAWRPALGLAYWLLPETGAVLLLALLGWRALARSTAEMGWLLAWLGMALATLVASGRFYGHYSILMMAPLAVLAGAGLAQIAKTKGPADPLAPRRLLQGLALAALAGFLWCDMALWLHSDGRDRSVHLYRVQTFANAPEAAARLALLCPEQQNLFIWGDEAELYYLAKRRPASRFLFTYPFTGEAPAWPDGEKEMLSALQSPTTGAAVLSKGLDPDQPMQRQIFDGLNQQFAEEKDIPGFILGARKR